MLILGSSNTRRLSRLRSLPRRCASLSHGYIADAVTYCQNPFPGEKIQWRTSVKYDHLLVGLGWSGSTAVMKPFDILMTLFQAKGLSSCPHKPDKVISDLTSPKLSFSLPGEDVLKDIESGTHDRRRVFPVAQNEGLRMLSLCSLIFSVGIHHVVVNQNACLACLLEACQSWKCQHLIL